MCFMERNPLTASQTNWNKPGLFGKLVLWNRPRGVKSQKTHKLIYDFLSVWTKEIKAIIFFPLHCISSNRIVLNRIELHCIVIEVNRIASVPASYVPSMYHIVGYASRCVSHWPQLWRYTSLVTAPSQHWTVFLWYHGWRWQILKCLLWRLCSYHSDQCVL